MGETTSPLPPRLRLLRYCGSVCAWCRTAAHDHSEPTAPSRERMRLPRFSRPTRRTVSLRSVGNLWAPTARAARSEYDAPSVRAADASDSGSQRPARYGQNDREITLLPTSRPLFHTRRLGTRFLAMAFRSDVWFLPLARDIEADLMWDLPSRASFGKVGSIMKRVRAATRNSCGCAEPWLRLAEGSEGDLMSAD